MPTEIYLFSISLPFATILIVFGMRYVAAIQQARAHLARDSAYRQTAESSLAAQSESAIALSAMQTSLANIAHRLQAIEKILKDVE